MKIVLVKIIQLVRIKLMEKSFYLPSGPALHQLSSFKNLFRPLKKKEEKFNKGKLLRVHKVKIMQFTLLRYLCSQEYIIQMRRPGLHNCLVSTFTGFYILLKRKQQKLFCKTYTDTGEREIKKIKIKINIYCSSGSTTYPKIKEEV